MTKKKKQKSILSKISYKVLGIILITTSVALFATLSISAFYPKLHLRLASNIFNWLGFSAIIFSPVFFAWGLECIKNNEVIAPIARIFSCILGLFLSALMLALLPFSWGGLCGKILARKLMSIVNNFSTLPDIKYIIASAILILAIISFNFCLGITYKNWNAIFSKTLKIIWKSLAMLGRAIKAILIKDVQKPEKRVVKPPKKEKLEPKLKPEPIAKTIPINNDKNDGYIKPSIALLSRPLESKASNISERELEKTARELEAVLQEFGINGSIVKVRPGPVVTLYELEPAPGTKTARVIGLADDIARSMSVSSVRIAVVTNSNTIGIEMPNVARDTVWLRELFEDPNFIDSKNTLNIVLGKNIGGENVYADLAKMPHLLVAGTTGSGKSVGINSMILSILYKMHPSECKMIMVDPKMLELSVYNGIPHLLTPVITDPAKAVIGLKWAVKEMEDRYRAMSKLNVRNILGYNKKLEELRASGQVLKRTVQVGFDMETGRPLYEEQNMDLNPLPYIVIVVDEMADLMLVAGKDVEAAIQRLAQMARAAGIHLIMATQRPSVDVITGTIKANFPTRISFQVTSKIDSRTILNEMGAEQLLGMGDMLYMPAGSRPLRVHGSFVKDAEVEKIVEFLKAQKEPEYLEGITESDNINDSGSVFDKSELGANGGEEDLYKQAVAIVQNDRKASTSYIQRKLRIGYNRAASLIDRMEAEGLVSAADHVGRRDVL